MLIGEEDIDARRRVDREAEEEEEEKAEGDPFPLRILSKHLSEVSEHNHPSVSRVCRWL